MQQTRKSQITYSDPQIQNDAETLTQTKHKTQKSHHNQKSTLLQKNMTEKLYLTVVNSKNCFLH